MPAPAAGDAPRILVSGAAGVVGRVLAAGWPSGRMRGLDLPEADVRRREVVAAALDDIDAVVHLAWDTRGENFRNDRFAPDNLAMTLAVLLAAEARGVRRAVLASSVHVHAFWPPPPTAIPLDVLPVPDSPYGASKLALEALGRHFAAHRGLEVVCLRLGGVNAADRMPAEPSEQAVWLRHADCVALVRAAATAPLPQGWSVAVGVSDVPGRLHALDNELGWAPLPGGGAAAH